MHTLIILNPDQATVATGLAVTLRDSDGAVVTTTETAQGYAANLSSRAYRVYLSGKDTGISYTPRDDAPAYYRYWAVGSTAVLKAHPASVDIYAVRALSVDPHVHTIPEITGLQAALDLKADLALLANKVDKEAGKTLHKAAIGDGRYVLNGAGDWFQALGNDGLLRPDLMPPIATQEVYTVANQAAMLALTCQKGDIAVRQDVNRSFILAAEPASAVGNWTELLSALDGVQSVNAKSGAAITLDHSDIYNLDASANYQHLTLAEKNRLAGLSNYVLPAATAAVLGGIKQGTGLTIDVNGVANVNYGSTAGTAVQGNDARLSDARTPTAHNQSITTITDTTTEAMERQIICRGVISNATAVPTTLAVVDGLTPAVGDVWLVCNANTAYAWQGVYTVTAAGTAWTRHASMDTLTELTDRIIKVTSGTAGTNTFWTLKTRGAITLGTTAVKFAQCFADYGSGLSQSAAGVVTVSSAPILTTARTIATSGDVVGTATSFNGSANITIPTALSATGVTAGTYKSVTVDAKGRVTAATNPTTIAGYGITDATTTDQLTALLSNKVNKTGDTMSGALSTPQVLSGINQSGDSYGLVVSNNIGAAHILGKSNTYIGWVGMDNSGNRRFAYEMNPSNSFGLYMYSGETQVPIYTMTTSLIDFKKTVLFRGNGTPAINAIPIGTDALGNWTWQDVGASHVHTFASLTGTPTTIAGYGITDAQPLDTDLSCIAALLDSYTGLLRKAGPASWTIDSTTYVADGDARLTNARTPLSHTHGWSDIVSGKPTTLTGYGIVLGANEIPLTNVQQISGLCVLGNSGAGQGNISQLSQGALRTLLAYTPADIGAAPASHTHNQLSIASTNESNWAYGFGGGVLHVNYRGPSAAITEYRMEGGVTTTAVVPVAVGTATTSEHAVRKDAFDAAIASKANATHSHTWDVFGYSQLLVSGTDMNTVVASGKYRVNNPANPPTPNGTDTWWYIDVNSHDIYWVQQTAFQYGGSAGSPTATDNTPYYRININGTWGGWKKGWTEVNFNPAAQDASNITTGVIPMARGGLGQSFGAADISSAGGLLIRQPANESTIVQVLTPATDTKRRTLFHNGNGDGPAAPFWSDECLAAFPTSGTGRMFPRLWKETASTNAMDWGTLADMKAEILPTRIVASGADITLDSGGDGTWGSRVSNACSMVWDPIARSISFKMIWVGANDQAGAAKAAGVMHWRALCPAITNVVNLAYPSNIASATQFCLATYTNASGATQGTAICRITFPANNKIECTVERPANTGTPFQTTYFEGVVYVA